MQIADNLYNMYINKKHEAIHDINKKLWEIFLNYRSRIEVIENGKRQKKQLGSTSRLYGSTHLGVLQTFVSDLELSVKSKFNGSKKVKTSHFINDLFNNTYNMLPEDLRYKNKYCGTQEEKKAILDWLSPVLPHLHNL